MTRLGFVFLLAMALLTVTPAQSQSEGHQCGQLNGTVQDPKTTRASRAPRSHSSNPRCAIFARQVTTGDNGLYTFTLIPPGTYQLKVEKAGFTALQQSNIVLAVGQSSTLNAQLQLGNVNQIVEVTAAAPVLNTGNADVGSEVSSKQAVELRA